MHKFHGRFTILKMVSVFQYLLGFTLGTKITKVIYSFLGNSPASEF